MPPKLEAGHGSLDMNLSTSVVMATYNGEKYITRQLDSIRNQTRQPDEVLIFDDCSIDGTVSFVEDYIAKYGLSNWKIQRNPDNLGWKANFANAISKSTGDITFLSDQDDVWDSKKIEIMADILEKNSNIEILACSIDVVYENENVPHIKVANKKYGKNRLEEVKLSGKTYSPIRPGCVYAFKSSIRQEFEKHWFQGCPHDTMLWCVGLMHKKLYILNDKLHMFYRNADNNTPFLSRNAKEQRIEYIEFYADLARLCLEKEDYIDDRQQAWLLKYIKVAKKRADFLRSGNLISFLGLLGYVGYYPKFDAWLGDLYTYYKSR